MYAWQCPNCGWDGQLNDEAQAAAVLEADKIQATHHIEHCPRCQWVVRIPVDRLRATAMAMPMAKKRSAIKVAAKKKTVKQVAAKKSAKRPAAMKAAARRKR